MASTTNLSADARQYLLITGNYWAFTLTDGALRMLVVLHFHQLGYSALAIAMLFVFYELFGVITNLVGGYLGARIGLNRTMQLGLALQVIALLALTVPSALLTVPWVMAAQALSGIAKDLNKMSAKSSIKLLLPDNAQGTLYKYVALLTGSKNALKGVGFFIGALLLGWVGFAGAMQLMAGVLALVGLASMLLLKRDLGKAKAKPKFSELFSKSRAINQLSAARLCLFAARDCWFVVALPVFLAEQLGWNHWQTGTFLACWIIGYGVIQGLAPLVTGKAKGRVPDGATAMGWALLLAGVTAAIAAAVQLEWQLTLAVVGGLLLFGAVFAINSSLHSYLIVSLARADGVSLDVGFYYMANAAGRLLGTLLSGYLYQTAGLGAALWAATALLATTALISITLPRRTAPLQPAQGTLNDD
ncbi:MAG: organoarsenical effux MFS transporter ArsJ [Gammaproteobacteria bacterium]|nr:organoarsenical effux MFS transporter ArsJ [Gammaproteobacteria bacterium]